VRSTDGEEVGRLLDEQRADYRALAADYLDQGLDLPGGDEVTEALDAFQPHGSVLELACGPGVWTGQLLRHATDVTAVAASPEMLAIAAARLGSQRVRFVQADLFTWKPHRRYDVVFFGFWLSRVPHQPADLERRLRQLGWHIKVTSTAGPFYWGAGSPGKRLT
jgi:ubiquinone/menaquinone biosynthesis C-methylase UbiE